MLKEINGTIKTESNEVVLVVAKGDSKEFKKYKHPTDPKKFYAGLSLNNQQLCITGVFKENKKGDTVTIPISSVNRRALTAPANIKALFGLDNGKKEIKVQTLKHSRKQLKELKPKIQELEDAKKEAKNELKTEELKAEAKNELKADQALKDEVKAALKTELTKEVKTQLKADQATITAAKAELKI
ncbi:MAG: hypothetical protein LBE46_01660 [Wolbachia pipientis]|jgi:sucrose-6-phosphate hydrolase SacC (GH32 family)|nr:hypothetical protein [Wolbachia pipientis]